MSNQTNKDEQEQKSLIRQQSMQNFLANSVTKKKGIGGHVRDTGLSLLSGAVSVPETAVGLADIVSGGNVGKFLENENGAVGFRPKEAKEAIAGWKTERSQRQLQDFQNAEGLGAKFGQAYKNPSLVVNTVLESLPAMGAGGVVGRGLGLAAKGLSPVAAGALGEGAVGAGLAAEQIRQQTADGLLTPKQAGLAAATGAATAGFGFAGGRLAKELGIADFDTSLVSGNLAGRTAAEVAEGAAKQPGIAKRVAGGALSEGFLEELPQSVSETILQNEALGRPLGEGVEDAAVLGLLSGATMGGVVGGITRNRTPTTDDITPTEDMGQEAPRLGLPNPNRPDGNTGLIEDANPDYFNRGQGPNAANMRNLNPDPELTYNSELGGQFSATQDGTVFSEAEYNNYLAQQQAQARATRDAGLADVNDITPIPEGYEQSGNDPRLPAPRSDFEVTPDGTAQTSADVNTSIQNERAANAERLARRLRGEIQDNTPVPDDAMGFGDIESVDNRKLSERMGLDPNKGGLSAAAVIAVDSGASPAATQMAGLLEVEAQSQPTGSKWLQGMRTRLENVDIDDEGYQSLSQAIEADPKSVPERMRLTRQIETLPQKPEPIAKKINPKARVIDEAKAQSVAYNPKGDKIPLQFDVVDASELLSSHSNNFVENPNYPQQYQPRDRAEVGYQAQVLDIVKNFNPELLGKDNSVNAGSPIVGRDDNLVESGNGRTIAIRRMYESGKGDEYRQFVNRSAEEFGLDTNAVNQMSQPVLVRRNNSDMDREQFALRANAPTGAAMSSSERAKADAKILPNADLLELDSNGSLNLKGSYKFTQAFISSLDKNEVNELVLSNGELSQTGQNRVSGALLQNAYGSSKLTKAVTEDIDSSAKNVLKTLVDKAPQITKINQSIKQGDREADTLSEDIKTAAETYIDLVESGANIDDYLNMEDMFGEGISQQSKEIVRDFYSNARSATRMGSRLQARIDAANRVNAPDLLADFETDAPNVLGNATAPTNTQAATQLTDDNPTVNIPSPKKAPRELSDKAMVREMQKPTAKNTETDYKAALNLSEGQNLGRLIMSSGRVFDDAVVKSMDSKGVTVEATVNGKRGLHKGLQYQTVDAGINNTKSYAEQQAAQESQATPESKLAEKYGFNDSNKLDHGELSIPNRTKNIDSELDRYKADKAKIDAKKLDEVKTKNTEKAEAEKERLLPIKEQAQADYKQYGTAMVNAYKDKLEAQGVNARDFIRDEAKYNPESFLKLSKKFQEEQQAETKKPTAKKADKPATPIETVAEIEDFGEKITGARKDMQSFYQREITDDDISNEPLSKIWPKKDIDAIEDKQTAALATVLRGTIPSKPRKGYKLDKWVAQVKNARGIMQQILSDNALVDDFIDKMTKVKGLQTTGYHAQLLSAIEQEQWARVTAVDHRPFYAIKNDDGSTSPDMSFDITIDKRRHIIPTENKQISEVVDRVNELLSGEVKAPTLKFDLYSRGRGDTKSWFITQASDKDKTALIEFNDRDTARAFLKENNADLTELWDQHKDKVNVKKSDMRSNVNRERIGPDHRSGQDVTTEQFMNTFGLRGGQFGNWVKQGANSKDRQNMLNDAYDAFMDLAGVLDIPPEAIGLGGKLAMSFGARGKGRAMAHYEPSQVIINLTKTKGAGSLAHEWFHALDHHFTSFRDSSDRNKTREATYITYQPEPSMMYTPQKGRGYLISKPALESRQANSNDPMYNAENWTPDPSHPQGVRPQVEEVFADLVKTLDESPMKERATTIDKGAPDGYWSRIIERAARAFESYVISKLDKQGARSDFLANVTPEDAFPRNMDRYPYLLESEMAPVAEAFDNLFATIDSKASEDGNGKTLFSRAGQMKQAIDGIKANAVGSTNTTRQQVINKLNDKFGKETIAKLMSDGKLDIKVLSDFMQDGKLTIPSDVDGLYQNGKATLIADNLSDDMIIPTFLHELGGHGGMQTLMDKKAYDALMKDFDNLVKAGDPLAVQAKAMADSVARNKQDALDEYLPYLITLASRQQGKQGKVAGMINRMIMAIRSWLKNTLGISMKMNAQDVLALAERMVEARAQTPLNNVESSINSFEGVNAPQEELAAVRKEQAKTLQEAPNGKPSNLTEGQWLQVRTPAFKQWFGDWENDPANASKILDENGEPLVMYHGSKSDFWAFDVNKSVPQRNNGMMGMFFTDNAKMAAGYTVDLSKDEDVIAARSEQVRITSNFGLKRGRLEAEGKTGDEIQELTKKEFADTKEATAKFEEAKTQAYGRAYDNASNITKAVFINSQAPFEQDMKGASFLGANKEAAENYATGIYDGVVNNNVLDDASTLNSQGPAKVVISFDANNIKSATDNTGSFDSANDDIRYSQTDSGMKFSRAGGMADQFDPINMARESKQRLFDWASSAPPGKLSWWHKTLGTMYNLSQRNPYFKPVYQSTEKFINDVSFYASKASEFAPRLLPQLDSIRDITKSAIGAKDNEALSKPIFEGTLLWGRDLDGKAVLIEDWRKKVMAASKQDRLQMLKDANRITPAQLQQLATLNNIQANRFINGIIDEEVNAGLVWTDSELRSKFNLDDKQIELYKEFRATTDNSLDSMTRSDMLRRLGKDAAAIETAVMEAGTLREAVFNIEQHINSLIQASPKKEKSLRNTLKDIKESQFRTNKLIDDGYAPLSRFGQYTVDVVDADGNREYFGMFESAYEARKMKAEMDALYGNDDDFTVTQGALSNEEFKLFAGVTPETAELFGEMMGLDATGDKAADDAFQEYLRRTKNNRSTMKRLMHRKGIKGYSEDVGRVLASFVYSNARHTSAALNMGNLDRSIQDIPKGEGQLKDAAVKLAEYIKNPQEEGNVIRGWMFAQYLGGSIASAAVNITQPIAVSFPYLSQFGGAVKAASQLSRSSSDWAKSLKNKNNDHFEADLREAIERAEADGTLSPQEIHNLLKQAGGKNPLSAGDGTKIGDAKAMAGNALSRVSLAWGSLFSLAEQVNRRVTFVAAYRMAVEQGMADPSDFATNSIKETQFVYNKASRMNWGRGAVGGTLMTFKTYTVSYMELMNRLWTQGEKGSPERKQGRQAVGIMIGTLFLLGGAGGLPFMEDTEDLVDGIGQIMGYNFSSKKVRQDFLDEWVGEMMGDFIDGGISSLPGSPTDVSGRLGLGNLIPGTGIFKERTSNVRDILELAGPAGDFVGRIGTGSRDIAKGVANLDSTSLKKGALEFAPTAVRNAVKGVSMATTGMYKDTKGYKVADTTPIDAAFKAIGFQPRDISKIQEANYIGQSSTSYYNLRASNIRALWAAGVNEGNQSKVADARAAVKDWNAKNPTQKIVIKPNDIAKRVREMRMDKSERVIKKAPKSSRGALAQDFAKAGQ